VSEWELTTDELRARHRGIEPHLVHPELGVEPIEDEPTRPSDRSLGLRWLALTEEEQRLRCRDMLRALLEEAVADEPPARFRLNDIPEASLDAAAVERLLSWTPGGWASVERHGRRWCDIDWGMDDEALWSVIVWVRPADAGALEERLSRAWWERAQRRLRAAEGRPAPLPRDGGRVSREARAQLWVGWDRFMTTPAIVLAAYVGGTQLPLPELVGAAAAVALALALLWTVDGLLRRWYARG